MSGKTFFDTVQGVYLEKRTGRLAVCGSVHGESPAAGNDRNLYFIAGDLYLRRSHPLAVRIEGWLDARSALEGSKGVGSRPGAHSFAGTPGSMLEVRDLVAELVSDITMDPGCETFHEGPGEIPLDVVGPISTAQLVLGTAQMGRTSEELLAGLGGGDVQLIAVKGRGEGGWQSVDLDPLELFLLEETKNGARVGDLLGRTDLSTDSTLRALFRLQAIDLVRSQDQVPLSEETGALSQQLAGILLARIREDLERDPLDLKPEIQQAFVKDLLARQADLTHFELLGLPGDCGELDANRAFRDLARRVHPLHSERLGFDDPSSLEFLFLRATEAYVTLSDPERSRRYVETTDGRLNSPAAVTGRARDDEVVAYARRMFESAERRAAGQQVHSAVQLMEQAVRMDPRSSYWAFLGRCQAHNPKWLREAAYSLSMAVQLSPDDAGLREELGAMYEQVGNLLRAREEYQAALDREPYRQIAQEGLDRLGSKGDVQGGGRLKWSFRRKPEGAEDV